MLVVIGVAVGLFVPQAGRFLVTEDRITHAELALVLSGDPIRRSLAARDLYRQGLVDAILVIPEPPDPLEPELVKLGVLEPNLPPWSERILVASGVPRAKLSFLPTPADGVITEALQVRRFLQGRFPATLVVITSKFASRRAGVVFRHVLKRDPVTVLCYPSPYDPFIPDRWWSHPRNALVVVMEYQKCVVNAFRLIIGPSVE